MKSLLIEILTEELPAIPLLKELDFIPKKWDLQLQEHKLESTFKFFYTPRRLVFIHEDFKDSQEDFLDISYGPPSKIAYTNGALNNIGESFLAKNNAKESELLKATLKDKEVLMLKSIKKGKSSKELLPLMVENFLKSLSFGKKMRWDDGGYDFIRAIRGLCIMHEDELIACKMYGVSSQKETFIHRNVSFKKQSFNNLKEYLSVLEKGCVILDQKKRKEKILQGFKELDITLAKDEDLLKEVVAITEYPTVIKGEFDKEFLKLPSEVIITSMREHQRYFASFKDCEKGLLNNAFVVVSNAVCKDFTKVVTGNEKVLKARLSDAMFFYQNDLATMLNNDALSKISFLDGLGTLLDKVEKEEKIAALLCKKLGCKDEEKVLKAVLYSKADLSSQMVYEFTNLQGVMGYYYALNMGLDKEIATAIKEQYLPQGEQLPSSLTSSILALATKIDSLLGLFSIGKIPSGSKDPFALRRAALGVLKILIKLDISFDLKEFLNELKPMYKDFELELLLDFIHERLFSLYELNPSFIKAVLASKNEDIISIDKSIKALKTLQDEGLLDLSVFKRLANIASKSEVLINQDLFTHKSERDLYEAFSKLDENLSELEKMKFLLSLKPELESFFENVMVNDKDENIKANRHALVYAVYEAFKALADLKVLSL